MEHAPDAHFEVTNIFHICKIVSELQNEEGGISFERVYYTLNDISSFKKAILNFKWKMYSRFHQSGAPEVVERTTA